NGKLDRGALPAPGEQAHRRGAYEPPRAGREQVLAQLWEELLQVPRVGRHDHFFDLGGHSLLAVQLVSRVRRVLGLELSLRNVFAAPVLEDMAYSLGEAASATQTHIPRADRARPIPLSPVQRQLWRWECSRTDRDHPALYCSALRLRGTLDRNAFVSALDAMVARHEILRTGIDAASDPEEPVQRIATRARFPLSEFDLVDLPPERRELRVFELYGRCGSEPFDTDTGPLVRAYLIRLDETTHVLILALHRLICDAWSLAVLIREAGMLYNAFRAGRGDPLPPLPVQFADYAVWFRDWLRGETLQRHVDHYMRHLEGAPTALTLPSDRPAPAQPSHRAGAVHLLCGGELSGAVLDLGKEYGITPSMTLLAAYALLLMRLSGQDDIVVGVVTGNRPRTELEALIGPFAQAVPMRLRMRPDMTISDYLLGVRDVALGAQDYQSLPADTIFEAMRLSSRPIAALFRFQNEPRSPLHLDGLRVEPQPDGPGGRPDLLHVDVSLVVDQAPDQLLVNMHYATDRYDGTTAQGWIDRYRKVLAGMAERPDRTIADWTF
ncbi:MAG: condensation domain-containing protein, partial [Pseudomonadota bacterium]